MGGRNKVLSCLLEVWCLAELTVGFPVSDSPAKRKPEEEQEKAKSDDSPEEEKDQVGLACSGSSLCLLLVHLLIVLTSHLA